MVYQIMFPENWLSIKTLVPNRKFPGEWIVPRSYGNFIGVDPSPSGAPCGARVAMLAKTGRGNDNDPGEFLQFQIRKWASSHFFYLEKLEMPQLQQSKMLIIRILGGQ